MWKELEKGHLFMETMEWGNYWWLMPAEFKVRREVRTKRETSI